MSNIDFTVNPICAIPGSGTPSARNLAARETVIPECEICGALADVEDTIYGPGGMKLLVTAYCEQCRLLISELVSRDLKNDSNDVARIVRAAQTAAKKSLRESARSSSRLECFDEDATRPYRAAVRPGPGDPAGTARPDQSGKVFVSWPADGRTADE